MSKEFTYNIAEIHIRGARYIDEKGIKERAPRKKGGFSKTISGRFVSLFRPRSVEGEDTDFSGPDLSRPRRGGGGETRFVYTYLRWVYLRTKWFLFGPRASCASHGGFVAAAWGKIVRQVNNKSKDAPRVGGELLLHLLPLSSASL